MVVGALLAVSASGCYVAGGEGFFCQSNDECRDGLYCYGFSDGSSTRRQCAEPGTRSVTGGYTIWGVYMLWAFTFLAPVGIVVLVVLDRRHKARLGATGASGPQAPGAVYGPPGSSGPPG